MREGGIGRPLSLKMYPSVRFVRIGQEENDRSDTGNSSMKDWRFRSVAVDSRQKKSIVSYTIE